MTDLIVTARRVWLVAADIRAERIRNPPRVTLLVQHDSEGHPTLTQYQDHDDSPEGRWASRVHRTYLEGISMLASTDPLAEQYAESAFREVLRLAVERPS